VPSPPRRKGVGAPDGGVGAGTAAHADVLLLLTRLNIGGPAGQALLLAKGMAPQFEARLVAGTPTEAEGEMTDPEVPVHRVPLVRPISPAADLRALAIVRRLINDTGPALVHTHMAKAGTIGRLAVLSSGPRAKRPRLVHTFHGHVLEGYFGGPQQRAFIALERLLARHTDVLVAVSPEVRDELIDLGVGQPAQYRVIPLGLDLAPFLAIGGSGGAKDQQVRGKLRASLGLGPDVPLAGIVGRLVPVKDHETLFAALATVPGIHLAVLGDGELRQALEGRAHHLGIGGRTHFTGWWADVPEALADLDVVVLASRNEGTPVALIEALAAARPVIATDVGGVRHVVRDSETGWLCSPGDPAALAAILRRVIHQPELAARMAEEGRRQVAQRFGQANMVASHVALYQELLSV
jgi:glycosyltransferase involved in cell wall biosynthesis